MIKRNMYMIIKETAVVTLVMKEKFKTKPICLEKLEMSKHKHFTLKNNVERESRNFVM